MIEIRPGSFWADLQRRRVPRAVAVYVVGAFATPQAAELLLPRLGLPNWTVTFVLALALLGLPIVALLAWTFQVTPDGVRRDASDGAPASLPVSSRLAVIGAIVVLALAGGAFAMLNRDAPPTPRDRIALMRARADFDAEVRGPDPDATTDRDHSAVFPTTSR